MNPNDIIARMRAEAKRRLAKAAAYLSKEVKVVLSVPAPRKVSKRTGKAYATRRATPGAPPRKLTGRLRSSVGWKVESGGLTAIVGTNVFYGAVHEHGNHPWLAVTYNSTRKAINAILRGQNP